MKFTLLVLMMAIASGPLQAQTTTGASTAWPRPIPCRIQDATNADLFVMTLGDVETPLAQGTFDPVNDKVTLKDGGVKEHYYRDVLGVKYYQPLDKSRFAVSPSGWCTWYYYYNRITATEVKRNAEWISTHLKDYGAQYVQVDDGWQGAGGQDGGRDWTHVNAEHFPNGMADVATYIKSLGLTPGLWLAPHGQSNPEFVTNHDVLFLHKQDGKLDFNQQRWEGRYLLDPSTPDSLDYFRNMFKGFTEWGYEYFKIDGQPTVTEEYRSKKGLLKNPSDDTDALYRKTLGAIRDVIGPDRYLLGCWGTPIEGAGIMNGSRTGGDIVLGWEGFQVALRPTMQYYYLHNIVWYSDPDVLVVRSPLTMDQARVWATLEGLTGQGLMSSDRLMDLSEDRVELMRRVYPATDIRPLDLFPNERDKRIWDLKINHLGRKYDVVGVFNFNTDKGEQMRLSWSDLGLPADKPVHVFDFWNKEYLGEWRQGMAVSAAPTSCRVLTLVPGDGGIQLVSTSRHITQGWVDLEVLKESPADNSISGKSKVVKNDPYELRFAFPQGTNYTVKTAIAHTTAGDLPVTIVNHQGWATVAFTAPSNTEVEWQAQFEPTDYYHYPPSDPAGVTMERVGLDGVNLNWQEQYYLNAGYQVYIDGKLLGYTPVAKFPVRGLDLTNEHTAVVKTVAEDGHESPGRVQKKINLGALIPDEISLTQIEAARSTGRWRGFEVDEMLAPASFTLGAKHFELGLTSFLGSETEFDLKGLFNKFTATVGLDGNSPEAATTEFVVVGDGRDIWKSGAMKKSDEPKSFELDVSGMHQLILRTTGGERKGRTQGDWVEPKLMK